MAVKPHSLGRRLSARLEFVKRLNQALGLVGLNWRGLRGHGIESDGYAFHFPSDCHARQTTKIRHR